MKALQFTAPNCVLCGSCPEPPAREGYARIRVAYAGICGTDLNIYAGTHPRAKAPLIIGHEFSGILMEDAGLLKARTPVTAYPLISCMQCTPCKSGNRHVCNTLGLYGIDEAGGMAEIVSIPVDQIIPLPETVSLKLGAFIEPIAVTVHTLRETGFKPGDNAAVFGCGTIGLSLALTLRKFGAGKLILFEADPQRIRIARELGFTVYDSTQENVVVLAQSLTGGDGFDHVYDCAGVKPVADILLDVVKVKGEVVIVASYKKPTELPLFKGMAKELSIRFVRVYRQSDFEIAVKLAQEEPLYSKLITHVFLPEEVEDAFGVLFQKGTGAVKVMFDFQ